MYRPYICFRHVSSRALLVALSLARAWCPLPLGRSVARSLCSSRLFSLATRIVLCVTSWLIEVVGASAPHVWHAVHCRISNVLARNQLDDVVIAVRTLPDTKLVSEEEWEEAWKETVARVELLLCPYVTHLGVCVPGTTLAVVADVIAYGCASCQEPQVIVLAAETFPTLSEAHCRILLSLTFAFWSTA